MCSGTFSRCQGGMKFMAKQWRPLRVLIVGRQDNFSRVLATNIEHWGHEVVMLPTAVTLYGDEQDIAEGDVLLYDLDESFRAVTMGKDAPTVQHGLLATDFLQNCGRQWLRAQFIITLSSRSVSRTMLEEIGAVALLQKPFEMGRLQRYLDVLRRVILFYTDDEEKAEEDEEHDSIRVLVVDDDRDIAQAISQCLASEQGYEVAVAYDGLAALERCVDWQPQCIVTDLIMPWMNGYQVMRCLSVGSARMKPAFVVMSALTQLEVPVNRSYLDGKLVAYVDKPFHIDHLLHAIKQVCAAS